MRFRAPMFDDATAVLDVLVARDIADLGVPDHTFEDLRDEWRESSFDLATDAFVAETDAGLIVGYAAIIGPGIQALVAPDHEGQGIGMRLLNWAEPRDRERGRERHRQWVAASNQRGRALLLAAGYQPAPRYWRLVRRLDDLANVESPPAGVNLRPLDVEADAATVYALNETSFAANPDYRPQPLITFYEEHLHAHDLDPATSCVAEHANMPIGFLLACQFRLLRTRDRRLAPRPATRAPGFGCSSWSGLCIGTYAAVGHHSVLIQDVLKGAWVYRGWVMSDWGATASWEFALAGNRPGIRPPTRSDDVADGVRTPLTSRGRLYRE
jgi:GNAT superfamily N-acetyltransferase